ncbi:D-sedoheptulose-7-phosphate isomerase [Allosalinactinospora lopnorensis]|uniref:D-sedoheptulose-7-phosphate isomerase n=1 Tax=Allosalinactinospora lopnorensis TaxID=1352348 RepID=UPI0009E1DA54|nr:SIS domain-containing protein [Allosalinactinospora lopnorensis]
MSGGNDDAPQSRPSRQPLSGLYPFLYSDSAGDIDAGIMAEVRRSTAEKAREITELRRGLLAEYRDDLARCALAMVDRFLAGARLLTFGNGGSSTDAVDVATTFLHPPRGEPLPALSLTGDVAVLTALSNDVGFEVVFSRQIAAFGTGSDIAFGLSTSGGSENVVRALEYAGRLGMLTIGLAGYKGGRLGELDTLDHLFAVPSASVHRIQEAQTTLYHVLWELVSRSLHVHSLSGESAAASSDAQGGTQ